MSNENLTGRIVNTNNHQDFITYADMLDGDKHTYNDNMLNPPPSSQTRPVSISYELAIAKIPKTPKKRSRNEVTNTRKENRSQQTELTELSKSTFLERLEASNKLIKTEIMNSIKTEIKLVNDETLKKVEEIIMTFQSFMLKHQSNTTQSSIINESNHQ